MDPSPDEKRDQHRVEAAIPVVVHGTDVNGIPFEDSATALEISRRGFSFLTARDLAVFASLTVVIPGRGPARPGQGQSDFFTEATVVRVLPEGESLHRVSVRFVGATLPMYSAETF